MEMQIIIVGDARCDFQKRDEKSVKIYRDRIVL